MIYPMTPMDEDLLTEGVLVRRVFAWVIDVTRGELRRAISLRLPSSPIDFAQLPVLVLRSAVLDCARSARPV